MSNYLVGNGAKLRMEGQANDQEEQAEEEGVFVGEHEQFTPRIANYVTDDCRQPSERASRVADQILKKGKSEEAKEEVEILIRLGGYIHSLRTNLSINREQLAKLCNIDTESIFLLEKGLLTQAETRSILSKISPILNPRANSEGSLRED